MKIHTQVQEVTTVSRVPNNTKVITREVRVPHTVVENHQKTYETKKAIFRTSQVVWYVLGIIEVLLAFRIALRLVGANPFSSFVNMIYALSDPFALPFQGVLGSTISSNSVLEWSTFVAMLVYLIGAAGLLEFMKFIKPTNPEEVEQNVDAV